VLKVRSLDSALEITIDKLLPTLTFNFNNRRYIPLLAQAA
jgi:hypothetical protein